MERHRACPSTPLARCACGALQRAVRSGRALARLTARVQVWIVENGTITTYPGDFEDYRQELVKEIAAELDDDA